MVRIAQLVDDVVAAIGPPSVMDGDALHLCDHSEVVHRDAASSLVAVDQGQKRARGDVHPVQLAGDPSAGLVEVHGRGVLEQVPHDVLEQPERTAGLRDHLHEGTGRDLHAEHVTEQLCHPVIGKVLMDSEIGSEGADSWSVAGRCRRVGRDGCLHLAPTPAPSSLDAVLGDERVDLRKVEDLAALDADHLGIRKIGSAVRAGTG